MDRNKLFQTLLSKAVEFRRRFAMARPFAFRTRRSSKSGGGFRRSRQFRCHSLHASQISQDLRGMQARARVSQGVPVRSRQKHEQSRRRQVSDYRLDASSKDASSLQDSPRQSTVRMRPTVSGSVSAPKTNLAAYLPLNSSRR